jgi:hypothetical protein
MNHVKRTADRPLVEVRGALFLVEAVALRGPHAAEAPRALSDECPE